MKEGLTSNSLSGFGEQFPPREPSFNSGLCLTVITTTTAGTSAALRAAKSLGKDLGARITMLSFEFVRVRSLLGEPFYVCDDIPEQDGSSVPCSRGEGEKLQARICLYSGSESDLPLILRRRAVVVLGGKRRWLPTREQKLERALLRLGHEVIFIEVGSKTGTTLQQSSLHFHGKDDVCISGQGAALYNGSETV